MPCVHPSWVDTQASPLTGAGHLDVQPRGLVLTGVQLRMTAQDQHLQVVDGPSGSRSHRWDTAV